MTVQPAAPPVTAEAARARWRPGPGSLVLAVTVLANLPGLMYPMGWDQATYGYYAEQILRGQVPYRDFWEINMPGTFLLYTAAFALLGATPLAVNLLVLATTVATTALLYRLALRWLGVRYAVVAGLIYGLSAALGFNYWGRAEPETFLGLASVAVLLLLQTGDDRPRWHGAAWFAAGVLMGCALVIKPTGGFIVLVALAYRWFLQRPPSWTALAREAALAIAGGAAPLVATVGYLAASGALPYLMDQWATYNVRYVGWSFGRGIQLFAKRAVEFFFLAVGPAPLLAAVGAVPAFRSGNPALRLAVAWTGLAFLTLVAQAFLHHYHYYVVLPAASLLAAHFVLTVSWRALWSVPRQRVALAVYAGAYLFLVGYANSGRVGGYVMALPAATGMMSPASYEAIFNWPGQVTPGRRLLVKYLDCHTMPGDPVYVTGEPAVYFLAHVQSPTRLYHEVPLQFAADKELELARYREGVEAKPPNFIAFYATPLTEYWREREWIEATLQPLLKRDYVRAFEDGPVVVYRHRSVPEGTSARCT